MHKLSGLVRGYCVQPRTKTINGQRISCTTSNPEDQLLEAIMYNLKPRRSPVRDSKTKKINSQRFSNQEDQRLENIMYNLKPRRSTVRGYHVQPQTMKIRSTVRGYHVQLEPRRSTATILCIYLYILSTSCITHLINKDSILVPNRWILHF